MNAAAVGGIGAAPAICSMRADARSVPPRSDDMCLIILS